LPFEDAKSLIQSFKLKSLQEFQLWCREGNRPDNFPSSPQTTYKNKGWNGWADFLGKDIEK